MDKTTLKKATELYIEVFTKEPWNDVYESYEEVEIYIQAFLTNDTYVNFVAMEDDEMIGLSLGLEKTYIKGIEYYIDGFCIRSDVQGSGKGSEFLSKIEKEIKAQGMVAIMLNTEKEFLSENFYLKNGFEQISDLIVLTK